MACKYQRPRVFLPEYVEDWIWCGLGEVAQVFPGVSKLELLGTTKHRDRAHARYVLAAVLRRTVMQRGETGRSRQWKLAWEDVSENGWRPISTPSLGSIFGRSHSTFVLADKYHKGADHLVRQVILRMLDLNVGQHERDIAMLSLSELFSVQESQLEGRETQLAQLGLKC